MFHFDFRIAPFYPHTNDETGVEMFSSPELLSDIREIAIAGAGIHCIEDDYELMVSEPFYKKDIPAIIVNDTSWFAEEAMRTYTMNNRGIFVVMYEECHEVNESYMHIFINGKQTTLYPVMPPVCLHNLEELGILGEPIYVPAC